MALQTLSTANSCLWLAAGPLYYPLLPHAPPLSRTPCTNPVRLAGRPQCPCTPYNHIALSTTCNRAFHAEGGNYCNLLLQLVPAHPLQLLRPLCWGAAAQPAVSHRQACVWGVMCGGGWGGPHCVVLEQQGKQQRYSARRSCHAWLITLAGGHHFVAGTACWQGTHSHLTFTPPGAMHEACWVDGTPYSVSTCQQTLY